MKNISPAKQRIMQFIEYLNISKRNFYELTSVSRGTLESESSITEDTLAKIFANYPQLNPTWVLTGEGNMILTADIIKLKEYVKTTGSDEDKALKAFSWLVFSGYNKKNGDDFSFDSFLTLKKIFEISITYMDTLQDALEIDISKEVLNKMIADPNEQNTFIIPESTEKVINKYAAIHEKLSVIASDLMTLLSDKSIKDDILESLKNKFKK